MPEMHLRQPGFTNSTGGAFIKNKEKINFLFKNRRFKIYLPK